jgi:hypothetical protein
VPPALCAWIRPVSRSITLRPRDVTIIARCWPASITMRSASRSLRASIRIAASDRVEGTKIMRAASNGSRQDGMGDLQMRLGSCELSAV